MDCTSVTDLDAVFQEYIQNDSGICDKCYKRVRRYYPPPEQVHRTSLRHDESGEGDHILRGETFQGGDGVYCYPPSRDGAAHDGGRIVCEDCGEVDYIPEARDIGDLITCSHRLRERLVEKGFGINDDAFYQTIRAKKATPETAAKDFLILEKATQRGIRAAWEMRGHPHPEDASDCGECCETV